MFLCECCELATADQYLHLATELFTLPKKIHMLLFVSLTVSWLSKKTFVTLIQFATGLYLVIISDKDLSLFAIKTIICFPAVTMTLLKPRQIYFKCVSVF